MTEDLGFIIGTLIILLFGLIIIFVIPKLVQGEATDDENKRENAIAVKWMRMLGIVLVVLSIGIIVTLLVTS